MTQTKAVGMISNNERQRFLRIAHAKHLSEDEAL
jgi:hypothetical protein